MSKNHENEQNSEEVLLNLDEMFISWTDTKGIIQTGNEVFAKIAGYRGEEIFQKPHNLIRHSDMPRSVFRLFWNYLKANRPIAALVKNKTKEGKFYWVLALASATKQGYFSVRIAPTRELINEAERIYGLVREVESKKGLDEGEKALLTELSKLGFSTYDEFMLKILSLSTEEREKKRKQKSPEEVLQNTKVEKRGYAYLYGYSFLAEKSFSECGEIFRKNLSENMSNQFSYEKIRTSCHRLHYLASNMSVSAQKLGRDGLALGIVAANFQKSSMGLKNRIEKIESFFSKLKENLEELQFKIFIMKLQIDVVAFQFLEILKLEKSIDDFGISSDRRVRDCLNLIYYVSENYLKLSNEIIAYKKSSKNVLQELTEFSEILLSLELIRTGGKLEGSRTEAIFASFGPFVEEMEQFTNEVKGPIEEMRRKTELVTGTFENTESLFCKTEFYLEQLRNFSKALEKFEPRKNPEEAVA